MENNQIDETKLIDNFNTPLVGEAKFSRFSNQEIAVITDLDEDEIKLTVLLNNEDFSIDELQNMLNRHQKHDYSFAVTFKSLIEKYYSLLEKAETTDKLVELHRASSRTSDHLTCIFCDDEESEFNHLENAMLAKMSSIVKSDVKKVKTTKEVLIIEKSEVARIVLNQDTFDLGGLIKSRLNKLGIEEVKKAETMKQLAMYLSFSEKLVRDYAIEKYRIFLYDILRDTNNLESLINLYNDVKNDTKITIILSIVSDRIRNLTCSLIDNAESYDEVSKILKLTIDFFNKATDKYNLIIALKKSQFKP